MAVENKFFPKLQSLIKELYRETNKRRALDIGIELSNEVLMILGADTEHFNFGEDALNNAFSTSMFRNQKQEAWYERHPYLKGARIALTLYDNSDAVYESNFYCLTKSATKARIAATVMLTENWEDSELTMLPNYKIGIDFFLTHDRKSLLVVLSKKGNLRVFELNERLTNTQIDILRDVQNVLKFDGINPSTGLVEEYEPQKTIHTKLWEALELQIVNKTFYQGVAHHFETLCHHLENNEKIVNEFENHQKTAQHFANRLIGRILFLWFLRKKNIINEQIGYFDVGELSSTEYYQQKLKTLFFDILNTPVENRKTKDKKTPYLNGGLFEVHPEDLNDFEVSFPQEWFNNFYAHLEKFNFTTDESTIEYQQIAIDPEMLGRVFENLLASIVPETAGLASERNNKGAFYTPREIVDYMCKVSLIEYFKTQIDNEKDYPGIEQLVQMNDAEYLDHRSTGQIELWGNRSQEVKALLLDALNNMKVLDPAVGSGAFPIGMLQLILKTIERLDGFYDENIKKLRVIKPSEKNDIYNTKLFIIRNMLYGSDIEPMAIEIARLRCWLSLIIDEGKDIEPLPNLEFNFVAANSLIKLKERITLDFGNNELYEQKFNILREKYFTESDLSEKQKLRKQFSEIKELISGGEWTDERSDQLASWDPFATNISNSFFDANTMFNVKGFDIVIGNPPYIHLERIRDLSRNLYRPAGYQTYRARGDIYTLFYEMGVDNLKDNGILTYITSNKWMRANYGEPLRDYFVDNTNPLILIDLGADVFDSATVDTNILVLKKAPYDSETLSVSLLNKSSKDDLLSYINEESVNLKYKKQEPWIILNEIEQSIKEKIEKNGTPLGEIEGISINYGIKTGLNEAFIIDEQTRKKILDNCGCQEEYDRTNDIIRPILRGRDIRKNGHNWAGLYIINTHNGYRNENGDFIDAVDIECYPSLKMHLNPLYHRLSQRSDQGDTPYNLRDCAYLSDFNKTKIMYSEIVSTPQFYLDNDGFIPEATCFFIIGPNLVGLTNYLNSDITGWVFRTFYSGGGLGNYGFRYKKVYLERLPVPHTFGKIKTASDIILEFNLSDVEVAYIKDALDT